MINTQYCVRQIEHAPEHIKCLQNMCQNTVFFLYQILGDDDVEVEKYLPVNQYLHPIIHSTGSNDSTDILLLSGNDINNYLIPLSDYYWVAESYDGISPESFHDLIGKPILAIHDYTFSTHLITKDKTYYTSSIDNFKMKKVLISELFPDYVFGQRFDKPFMLPKKNNIKPNSVFEKLFECFGYNIFYIENPDLDSEEYRVYDFKNNVFYPIRESEIYQLDMLDKDEVSHMCDNDVQNGSDRRVDGSLGIVFPPSNQLYTFNTQPLFNMVTVERKFRSVQDLDDEIKLFTDYVKKLQAQREAMVEMLSEYDDINVELSSNLVIPYRV